VRGAVPAQRSACKHVQNTERLLATGAAAAKVTSDSNPNALDAGLDALNAFLLKADDDYASRCGVRSRFCLAFLL
jgi:hypothetical protein